MAKKRAKKTLTLTEQLQAALGEVESIRAVARETGLHHASLLRFVRGERSLKLDNAEKLMEHFGIEAKSVNEE